MNILLDQINIALIIIILVNGFLGIVIFLKGSKKKINIIYTLNILTIASWVVAMVFFRSAQKETVLFWSTMLYLTPTFIASSFLYFVYIFLTPKEKNILLQTCLIFLINLILVVMIIWPGLIIEKINIHPGSEKEIFFTPYYWFYFLYIFSFFNFGFYKLFCNYLKSTGTKRLQILYFLLGSVLTTTFAFVTNLIMPWLGYFFLNWVGQICTIIMVTFITYAIVRYRLMDIKVVLRKSTVYLASLSVVLVLAMGIKYVFSLFFTDITDWNWVDLIILITVIFLFTPIKSFFYKIANKYFFTSLYDSGEVIAELSDKLRTSLQINQIYTFVHDILTNSFHTKVFEFWKYNQKTGKYSILYSNGVNFGGHKKIQSNKYLHEKFIQNNQPIVTEEIRNAEYNQNTKEFIDLLSSLKIEVLVPLNIKEKTVGLLALGQKETGDMYNNEDFMVLRVAGSQVAVAIENASLYEETQNFNIKLKKEIHTATQDLLVANQRLMRLDQAKSEFISIASHQLRTPLTVIKGYLSMILEGDFGKVGLEQKDPLNKVYLSGERMIHLVNDLLNVSRIETGRLEFNYEAINLENMISNIVDDLKKTIKQKDLLLDYIKSPEQLPLVKIDQEKMRQTIINVIDNAIKYTKQGNIIVSLKMVDGKIQFCVSDSGAGISQDDLPRLFKKFSRGKTISKMYMEGTGLGLYVARKMVEAHKGKIWAESKGENKGSQFYFELPVD